MKRVFPAIVTLITLSVLGILFIQMSWIRNAIFVKREQYQKDLSNAVYQLKDSILDSYLDRLPMKPLVQTSRQYDLDNGFTIQTFSEGEVEGIIDRALKRNNIKQHFEFAVTNIFHSSILNSAHWSDRYWEDSQQVPLTGENALQQETLFLYVEEPKNYIISQMGWMIVASIILTTIIIWAFALTVRTLFNQKKLSEIKSDFINNMTHELKTPLATISLAVDALNNPKVLGNEEQTLYYSGMIKEENKRMNKQVETILQAARLERQEISLNLVSQDAHEVIRKVANNLTLQLQEKQGHLTLKLDAAKHMLVADEVHFSNVIFNLLDNAIKYSKDNLQIQIQTLNQGNKLLIRVKDNGIGMSKETQSRIFEKFYRAHTGNLHDVKGFGLGLSYVKGIAEAHHGAIKVDSAVGKGTTFTIVLPLQQPGRRK